ncbi:hypothetical protein LguiB_025011 [Lonicera macranthoides]
MGGPMGPSSDNKEAGHVLFRCGVALRALFLCGINISSISTQSWDSIDLAYIFLGSRVYCFVGKEFSSEVNFDASFFFGSRSTVVGVVIRNSIGEFVVAMSKQTCSLMSPSTTEAMMALNVVIFAHNDDLFLKLWEVMLPDDNNMYHIFVSTSIPPTQFQSKLNLNLNHENIPDAELEQMIEDINETYEVITSALRSDVTNDGYRNSSSETESEEGADWPSYEVKAPIISRGSGKPKSNRHKANDENEPVAIKRKCQNCGTYGHNKRTCKGPSTNPNAGANSQTRGSGFGTRGTRGKRAIATRGGLEQLLQQRVGLQRGVEQ